MTSESIQELSPPRRRERVSPCSLRIAATDPSPTTTTTAYVVVRRDLPLGHIAAQVAHAAGSVSRHPPGTYVVVLAAASEAHLKEIAGKLDMHGVHFERIEESDGAYAGQLMSLGLELVTDRAKVRKVVSSLPLLR